MSKNIDIIKELQRQYDKISIKGKDDEIKPDNDKKIRIEMTVKDYMETIKIFERYEKNRERARKYREDKSGQSTRNIRVTLPVLKIIDVDE